VPDQAAACAACREGAAKGYFVTSDARGLFLRPGFFRWWNPAPVCALDLTNPEAVAWFVHRLRSLQAATGVDGFKFDAGAHNKSCLGSGELSLSCCTPGHMLETARVL
jgi:alpha-glucosidase (family GH31 glycosyl hydrolase)